MKNKYAARMASIILCAAMLFTLLPTTALAADATTVTVGKVTLSNGQYTTNGTVGSALTGAPDSSMTSYAYFHGVNGKATLTLKNFTYDGSSDTSGGSCIDISRVTTIELTIELIGTNTLTPPTDGYGIRVTAGDTTIDGGNNGGTLVIKPTTGATGIDVRPRLLITKGSIVTMEEDDADNRLKNGIYVFGTLTIEDNSTVTVEVSGDGIHSSSEATLTNSSVTANTSGSFLLNTVDSDDLVGALRSDTSISITGGTTELSGGVVIRNHPYCL